MPKIGGERTQAPHSIGPFEVPEDMSAAVDAMVLRRERASRQRLATLTAGCDGRTVHNMRTILFFLKEEQSYMQSIPSSRRNNRVPIEALVSSLEFGYTQSNRVYQDFGFTPQRSLVTSGLDGPDLFEIFFLWSLVYPGELSIPGLCFTSQRSLVISGPNRM